MPAPTQRAVSDPPARRTWLAAGLATALALLLGGCSIRGLAINALADSLAKSGDVFASDEDPELVREATPFALKTIEALLAEKPSHRGLLLSACRGFAGYAYAFVELDALELEEVDYEAAERQTERALKLYLRARDYCVRSLAEIDPGIRRRLQVEPEAAVAGLGEEEVPLLFWTAAAWGSALGLALDRPDLTVDLPAVEALIERAAALDESYGDGAVHEALMSLAALPPAMGGSPERARHHFERAVELSGGRSASPYVGFAVKVSIQQQDREEFQRLLETALAVDPDAEPANRLQNILSQRRARWLLERVDELFL
ncbi:MAG: TRAP transporter TatT component family protein [Thermoanaerobaculia bacterium]|nr:TRAP transporter TatT component family protein [Thermoanaerobaculia bacterium]